MIQAATSLTRTGITSASFAPSRSPTNRAVMSNITYKTFFLLSCQKLGIGFHQTSTKNICKINIYECIHDKRNYNREH